MNILVYSFISYAYEMRKIQCECMHDIVCMCCEIATTDSVTKQQSGYTCQLELIDIGRKC